MKIIKEFEFNLFHDEAGEDLTEYALLLILLALVALAALKTLGIATSNIFSNAASSISSGT